MSYRVVLTTVGSRDDAAELARVLVQERLAACVNILLGVDSVYWWEGQVQEDREFLLLIKTREELLDALEERLGVLHPYQVPEIIALPIEWGSKAYLDWVRSATRESDGA